MPKNNKFQKNIILLYTAPTGDVKIEVLLKDETIWLTQKKMSVFFDVDRSVITKHLQNIFETGELDEKSVSAKIAHTANDKKTYVTLFYNLDSIISVGYRVNSEKATQFRIWATKTLREFVIKGFVLDDDRLKNGAILGKDYFQELLERVRSIRASERRIYQQITDIFAECSIDYNPISTITKDFFATVQNKFHFAIASQTAAEIIYTHADRSKKNMGLTTWRNSPKDRILQSDTKIAKNYLSEKDIKRLERTVSGFFDYVENLIERKKTFTMQEFAGAVDKFLSFNEYKILHSKGSISQSRAEQKAISEYKAFNKTQKVVSDFDKEVVKKLKKYDNK